MNAHSNRLHKRIPKRTGEVDIINVDHYEQYNSEIPQTTTVTRLVMCVFHSAVPLDEFSLNGAFHLK